MTKEYLAELMSPTILEGLKSRHTRLNRHLRRPYEPYQRSIQQRMSFP